MKKKKCPYCNGTGEYIAANDNGTEYYECENCKGAGKI
jgi:DnaJ-class molecular chaperone